MSIEDTLSVLKRKIDSINTRKIENSTKLKALEEEKQLLLVECGKLGVDPAQLEQIVLAEETKLHQEIERFESEVGKAYSEIEQF